MIDNQPVFQCVSSYTTQNISSTCTLQQVSSTYENLVLGGELENAIYVENALYNSVWGPGMKGNNCIDWSANNINFFGTQSISGTTGWFNKYEDNCQKVSNFLCVGIYTTATAIPTTVPTPSTSAPTSIPSVLPTTSMPTSPTKLPTTKVPTTTYSPISSSSSSGNLLNIFGLNMLVICVVIMFSLLL